MNIYKNFIDKDHCNKINKVMLSLDFPWFYAPYQNKTDSSFMFHCFYRDDKINSGFYYLIEPLLKKLNIKKLINIRANLSLKRPMKSNWHSDFENLEHILQSKVALYYVNTNNGYTAFKNKKVKCIKNQMAIFDGGLKHQANYQTDTDTRMVINFCYEFV